MLMSIRHGRIRPSISGWCGDSVRLVFLEPVLESLSNLLADTLEIMSPHANTLSSSAVSRAIETQCSDLVHRMCTDQTMQQILLGVSQPALNPELEKYTRHREEWTSRDMTGVDYNATESPWQQRLDHMVQLTNDVRSAVEDVKQTHGEACTCHNLVSLTHNVVLQINLHPR